MSEIPEGFEPLFRSSPYLDLIGPIFSRSKDGALILGLRAEQKHCNARDAVHGGVLSTIADVALGYNAAYARGEPLPLVTANLSIDYAGAARRGDWIEVHTDVQKAGRRIAFANAYFHVGDKRIARASAVFAVAGA